MVISKNKKLRILYVLQSFPKLSETFILNEIVELIELGHDITILAKEKGDDVHHEKVAKYNLMEKTFYSPVYKFDRGRDKLMLFIKKVLHDFMLHPFKTSSRFRLLAKSQKNIWYAMDSYLSLEKVFFKKFDLIQTGFSSSHIIDNVYLLSKILNIPFSLMFRAYELYRDSNVKKLRYRMKAVKQALHIITISEYNKNHLESEYGIRNVPIVHDAIDINDFKPIRKRNKKRVIAVGRFVEQKGLIYLIEAVNILNKKGIDFELFLIGDGPEKESYESMVKKYKLSNVIFAGLLSSEEVKEEISNSAVFVLPCIITPDGNRDILANVLKEAMAMEVPVITSNICGIEELVEDGVSGYLIPPEDPKAIANALKKVLSNPTKAKKMSVAGHKKIVQDYNIKTEVQKLEEIFTSLNQKKSLFEKGNEFGHKLYDKPLLVAYSRSGTNWIRYIVEFLTKKPTPGYTRIIKGKNFALDHAHMGFAVMKNYDEVILIVRDYKECLLRHLTKHWKTSSAVKTFLEQESSKTPPSGYIRNIQEFDKFKGKKLLIYYEDLILNPQREINKLVKFLNLPKNYLKELLNNLDYHKKQSVTLYMKNQKSITKGSIDKLKYHSKKLLSTKEKIEFDAYYEKNYSILFKKYLQRYKENRNS